MALRLNTTNQMVAEFARVLAPLPDDVAESGYEYDNIQEQLNRMTETELNSERGHRLMDRSAAIRECWRRP